MSPFRKKPGLHPNTKRIKGHYDKYRDWVKDPKGYFLIRVNREKRILEAGHCTKDNLIEKIFFGKTPQEVYFAIIKSGLVSLPEHAAYLGKELEKAYIALEHNLKYVQDKELKL